MPGSARLELVSGIRLLHAEDVILEAMLSGWEKEQRGRRNRPDTIDENKRIVRQFTKFTDEYPWNWTATHMDEWSFHLIAESGLAESTTRSYQGTIRTFCTYITSPHYHWAEECEKQFGTHPIQICHEWNTTAHLVDYEGQPDRRPLTRDEIQLLFDHADEQVDRAVRLHRKGALQAYRDATVLKVLYAWGLRCNEACKLDLVDWYRNPKATELGKFGQVHVRYGKASKGSPPKRRTVQSVMPWAVEAVDDYITNIRPKFGHEDKPAMWLTERGGRLKPGSIGERFASYRDELKLDPALSPHCLRHSHVTHQIEDGTDPKFVQEQVGHKFQSTTGIYTGVSGDFMNTIMRNTLDRAFEQDEEGWQ